MSLNKFTYATATNAGYIEEQYEKFRKDPAAVEASWRQFFEGYEFAASSGAVGTPDESPISATPSRMRT